MARKQDEVDFFDDVEDFGKGHRKPPITGRGRYSRREEPDEDDWFAEETPRPSGARTIGKVTVTTTRRKKRFPFGALLILLALVLLAAGMIASDSRDERQEPETIAHQTETQRIELPVADTVEPTAVIPVETQAAAPAREYRYFGSRLNDQQRMCYDRLLEGITNHDALIEDIILPEYAMLEPVSDALWHDYPELFWYTGAYSCTYYDREGYVEIDLTPEYEWSAEQSAQNRLYVEAKTQYILNQLSGLSDYEKVKGVYEYLIDNTAYDYDYYGKTLYELFAEGRAVCEGYARSAQYLLTNLGVETLFVVGEAGEDGDIESHSWNIVKVGGDYYQMDATWGDPYHEDGTQTKNFNFLCITDQDIQVTHSTDWSMYPACTATEYNYFRYEGNYLEYYDTDILAAWMAEADRAGKPLLFKMADAQLYQEVMNRLFEREEIWDLFRQSIGKTPTYWYQYFDKMYVIELKW